MASDLPPSAVSKMTDEQLALMKEASATPLPADSDFKSSDDVDIETASVAGQATNTSSQNALVACKAANSESADEKQGTLEKLANYKRYLDKAKRLGEELGYEARPKKKQHQGSETPESMGSKIQVRQRLDAAVDEWKQHRETKLRPLCRELEEKEKELVEKKRELQKLENDVKKLRHSKMPMEPMQICHLLNQSLGLVGKGILALYLAVDLVLSCS